MDSLRQLEPLDRWRLTGNQKRNKRLHMRINRLKAALLTAMGVSLAVNSLQAQAPDSAQGRITAREYDVSGANNIDRLTSYAGYPDSPDRTSYPNIFEWPTGPDGDNEDNDDATPPPGNVRDNYATEIRGYIHPASSGTYYFALASDDPGELWLSTDSDFGNMELIATEPTWNGVRAFASEARRTFDEDRGSLENQSAGVRLESGQAYAIMARAVEGGGGDNLAIAWNTDGPEFFEDGQEPILGEFLSTFDRESFGQPFFRSLAGGADGFTGILNDGQGAGAVTVDESTISVTLDGADVVVSTSKDGELTTISHQLDGNFFEAGSDHDVVISYNGTSVAKTFTVAGFATVPASARIDGYSSNNRGFSMRVLQSLQGIANATGPREEHLAGTLVDGNGDPLENVVDDFGSASNNDTWEIEGVINFDQDGAAQGVFRDSGDGSATDVFDDFIPGIPGLEGSTDQITAEILTVVEIPASGLYNFAFNSDDGFKTTAGAVSDAAEAIVISEFSGGRGAATTFGTVLFEEPGFYKLRSLWYEGGGGANLEWWTADGDNNPIALLNDDSVGGLKTYRDIPEDPAAIIAISPADGTGEIATAGTTVSLSVRNGSTSYDTGSATGTLNGAAIEVSESTADGVVTLSADTGELEGNTEYSWEISFTASGGARTAGGSFRTTVLAGEGLLFIETEDFNFELGKWDTSNPIGMTGAYPGGTYQDLGDGLDEIEVDSGTSYGVDYFETNNANSQAIYRPDTGVEAGKTNNGTIGLFRGAFDIETNNVVGWNDGGDWYNYTREFPEPAQTYAIFGHISSGGSAIDTSLLRVTSDASVPGQDTELIGHFRPGRATAGWDNYEIFPLIDDDGEAVVTSLGGTTTLRYSVNGGNNDNDYIVFVPASATPEPPPVVVPPVEPPVIPGLPPIVLPPIPGQQPGAISGISRAADGSITIEFTGSLQAADTVNGTFAPVAGAASPFAVDASGGAKFYIAR